MDIFPLSPERWNDFEALLGPSGACYGCWCLYFRLPPKARQETPPAEKKEMMRSRITLGPPPGLIGYVDGKPVAWMQIGPRSDVPEWNNAKRVTEPLDDISSDDPRVWAISCFFFKSAFRGRGLSHTMVAAGVDFARESGAGLLEACPMDKSQSSKSAGLFVGSTSVFTKAGFQEVACRKPGRPLMRLEL